MLIIKILFIGAFAVFFSFLASWIARKWKTIGLKEKAKDTPARWSLQPKPTVGGIVFFAAFLVSFFLRDAPYIAFDNQDFWLLLGGTTAFAVGLWDDIKRISPSKKIVGQLVAAFCIVHATGAHWTDWSLFNPWITLVFTVGIMNSINMYDNMDGAAGTASLGAVLFFIYGPQAFMAMALAGALLAFLLVNWKPAKIYMGDSGSLLLGFWLSYLILTQPLPTEPLFGFYPQSLWLLLMVLPLTVADTVVVIVQRILHRRSPMQGGRDHTTHHWVYMGVSEKWVAVFIAGILALNLCFGLDPLQRWYNAFWFTLVYFFALLVFQSVVSFRNLKSGKFRYPS
jgi:UDP-GlcNAc:undecaprenyl-phosphate/decaprenyl-phosphate GlcNAc-1-phosphate transferase